MDNFALSGLCLKYSIGLWQHMCHHYFDFELVLVICHTTVMIGQWAWNTAAVIISQAHAILPVCTS